MNIISLLQREKVAFVARLVTQMTDEVDPFYKNKLLCVKEPHQSSLRSDSFPKGKPIFICLLFGRR